MSLHDTLVDILEALDELRRDLLLVTDTQILQVEGCGVTSISTHLGPLVGSGVAIGPLNEVDSLSYPFVHLAHGNNILSLCRPHVPTTIGTLTADTAGQNGNRLHAEVFAELEILIVTKTHALMVTPGILQTTTGLLRTNGSLPTIGVPETITTTMYYATTREAHELRMQVGKGLSEVRAQTVSLIGVFGHQRYHVDIQVAGVQHQQLQNGILTVFCGSEHGTIFLPLLVANGDGCLVQHFGVFSPSLRNGQHNADLLGLVNIAEEGREIILRTSLYRDAIIAAILQTKTFPAFVVIELLGTFSVETHVGGIVRMDGVVHTNLQGSQRVSWTNLLPGCARAPTVSFGR